MNQATKLGALEQALGYKFRKSELITEALTHRSHHHEFGDSAHNERLEFLGDAVIDLCVTESLMELRPTMTEGDLSKMRSQVVSEASLARAARRLGVGQAVRLGRGEDRSGGRDREALLADTFEAVMAAVYLDGGLDSARDAILRLLEVDSVEASIVSDSTDSLLRRDSKSCLQELCQGLALGVPNYRCLETRGPDHKKRFVMGLFVQEREIMRAEGATKKEATQAAANAVLEICGDKSTGLVDYLLERGLEMKGRAANKVARVLSQKPRKKEKTPMKESSL